MSTGFPQLSPDLKWKRNAQRPTPNAQRPTPNAQRPTPNVQCAATDSQSPAIFAAFIGRWALGVGRWTLIPTLSLARAKPLAIGIGVATNPRDAFAGHSAL